MRRFLSKSVPAWAVLLACLAGQLLGQVLGHFLASLK